jgi:hypothetical protein
MQHFFKVLLSLTLFFGVSSSVFASDISTFQRYQTSAYDPSNSYPVDTSCGMGSMSGCAVSFSVPSGSFSWVRLHYWALDCIEPLPYIAYNIPYSHLPPTWNNTMDLVYPSLGSDTSCGSGSDHYIQIPANTGNNLIHVYTSGTGNPYTWHSYFMFTSIELSDPAPTPTPLPPVHSFDPDVGAGLSAGIASFSASAKTQLLSAFGLGIFVLWTILMMFKMIHWFIEIMQGKRSSFDERNVKMKGTKINTANIPTDPVDRYFFVQESEMRKIAKDNGIDYDKI